MSVTAPRDPETYACAACGGPRTPHESVRGSYCSPECFYRDTGAKALTQIERDHTLCATCFRAYKSVQPPAERHPDWVIGWQYPTESTVVAIDEHVRDRGHRDRVSPADRVEHTRWACDCGAVDSRHRYLELERVDPEFVLRHFALCLDRLACQDAIGGTFDLARFRAAVGDHYLVTDAAGLAGHDWIGWAELAGRSLYQA